MQKKILALIALCLFTICIGILVQGCATTNGGGAFYGDVPEQGNPWDQGIPDLGGL